MSYMQDSITAHTELRYADFPDGRALDEIVADWVHVEDLGGAIYIGTRDTQAHVVVERIPMSGWWREIVQAWHCREWPCLYRPALKLMCQFDPETSEVTLDANP